MTMHYTLFFMLLLVSQLVEARGLYQQPADFLREIFHDAVPPATVLWLTQELRHDMQAILGHPVNRLRLRYWLQGQRTAWILEEIGKEQPITVGIVIQQGQIEQVKVLIFRESRGAEIRHSFFTDQFNGAGLTKNHGLTQQIDGISGATLSVRAVKKLARLALLLHQSTTGEYDAGQ